ncbi:hypothetical protein ABFS82_10G143900 [Erythranthe guttata]|uniref:RRM domain-containing protein n=1 Tax=Erythranthe guttata TaxID=4155 RepID=A0A022R6M1_ERYGU|nr:PREDICTED: UBP1-associated protein 2B [Erythranthe guttata]EYU35639.1 hypothetical protein MIMGU_mgv1a006264mg [Erythranthe guttata]|eukprot:XP_012839543.1 PREDICTED: UBP1-associated protein 2B [Erythranthe guttata]
MAKKRKAPSSQQSNEPKLKAVREEVVVEPEEEEDPSEEEVEESSSEEDAKSKSKSESESESESDSEEEESSSSDEEATDEASKKQSLRQLLEPFGKSQIIDLLKEAAAKDPNLVSQIVQAADADPTHRNIFVRGLGWDATSDQLVDTFKPYGEIEESKLIMDKATGRAKGYAFVRFKTRAAAKKALKVTQKKVGSKTVTCQLASTGVPAGDAVSDVGSRKIYIGNVGPHVSPDGLKSFFERFGEIEEGPFGVDPVTGKFRGFAMITYKSLEGYKKVMEEPIKVFDNCQLHCKKFVDNFNKNNAPAQNNVGSAPMNPNTIIPSDTGYGGGMVGNNAGFMGNNFSGSGLLMAQNQALGMMSAGYNPVGFSNPMFAAGLGGGGYGISNSMTGPSMIGNYGSQAALLGLGAFQNNQTGQSSSIGTGGAPTPTATIRPPSSGVSAPTNFPTYFNR